MVSISMWKIINYYRPFKGMAVFSFLLFYAWSMKSGILEVGFLRCRWYQLVCVSNHKNIPDHISVMAIFSFFFMLGKASVTEI